MGTKFRRETEARQLCYVICHRLYIFICYWSTAAWDVCFCLVDCFLVVMGFYYWYAFCCYGIADQTFLCVCVLQTSVFMASLFGISLHAMCLHIQYYKKILHIQIYIYIYKCTFFDLNHSFFVHSLCKFISWFNFSAVLYRKYLYKSFLIWMNGL